MPHLTSHLYDLGRRDSIKVVDTECGRIGITICADNFDIDNPKKVTELGAWLLITPHCYAAPEADVPENAVRFINHIRKIAKETSMWVIGSNICLSEVKGGEWKDWLHSGCYTIADPTGKVVTLGQYKEPDIIIYDIIHEKTSTDKE